MRKLFCAVLALILLAGLACFALAEPVRPEAAPDAETSGEDPGADDVGFPADTEEPGADDEGFFPDADEGFPPDPGATPGPDRAVDVDGQYTFTCPGALIPVDIEQQDMADGLLFSAFSDTMGVDVYKYEQGEDTVESLYEAYKADDSLQEVTLADISGVKALVYRIDETGINVTVAGETGFLYDIMLTYQTPEEYQQMGAMIASIKKAGAQG